MKGDEAPNTVDRQPKTRDIDVTKEPQTRRTRTATRAVWTTTIGRTEIEVERPQKNDGSSDNSERRRLGKIDKHSSDRLLNTDGRRRKDARPQGAGQEPRTRTRTGVYEETLLRTNRKVGSIKLR